MFPIILRNEEQSDTDSDVEAEICPFINKLPDEMIRAICELLDSASILQLRSSCLFFEEFLRDKIRLQIPMEYGVRDMAILDAQTREQFMCGFRHVDLYNFDFEHFCIDAEVDLRPFKDLRTLRVIGVPESLCKPLIFHNYQLQPLELHIFPPFSLKKLELFRTTLKVNISLPYPEAAMSLGHLIYRENASYKLPRRELENVPDSMSRHALVILLKCRAVNLEKSCVTLNISGDSEPIPLSATEISKILVGLTLDWNSAFFDNLSIWMNPSRRREYCDPFDMYIQSLTKYFNEKPFDGIHFPEKRLERVRIMLDGGILESPNFKNIDSVLRHFCSETIILIISDVGIDLSILFSDKPVSIALKNFCLIFSTEDSNESCKGMLSSIRGSFNSKIQHFSLKLHHLRAEKILQSMLTEVLNTVIPCCPNLKTMLIELDLRSPDSKHTTFESIIWPIFTLPTATARSLDTILVESWQYEFTIFSPSFSDFVRRFSPKRVIIYRHSDVKGPHYKEVSKEVFTSIRFDILDSSIDYHLLPSRRRDVTSIKRIVKYIDIADLKAKIRSEQQSSQRSRDMILQTKREPSDPKNFSYYTTNCKLQSYLIPEDGEEF
ncbi:unnamed protein product [Bemisia tabaci]|uniref:F-box domain-containing protein n=1 Tax=Bemisia tabaci TaxID=7038 RepID=A0A9P0F5N6_BEMTA|nr:unnamed protein product [Bemisia tabaci]